MCRMLPKAFFRSSQAKQMARWLSFGSQRTSHDSVAWSTQPDILGRNSIWMRPSRYLFGSMYMYGVFMDVTREKKIFMSLFDSATVRSLSGSSNRRLFRIRTMTACCQKLFALAYCQTLQHTVYIRCCSEEHLFQTRYGVTSDHLDDASLGQDLDSRTRSTNNTNFPGNE